MLVATVDAKISALLGISAPLVGSASMAVSILSSPWFRWERNALSDLGHSVSSNVAPIFNCGLLLAGFFLALYSAGALDRYARWAGFFLTVSAFLLQAVAVFDEVYGRLHFVASVAFFISLATASLSYALERRSLLAVVGLAIGLAAWLLYWLGPFSLGVAVPEAVSTLASVPWVLSSAVRVYREESTISWP